ncbi:MAG: RHS repeat-associated core domain-containing protein, partial [Methylomonas sp.]
LWDSAYRNYDQTGRLRETLDSGGNAMQYQYDAAGNLIQITDPDSYTLGYSYDAANRWIKAYDKANHAISRTLDASGRVKTTTDANGNTTAYSYYGASQNGRLLQVTQPAAGGYTSGVARQYSYDALGHATQTTDVPATGSTQTSRNTLNTYNALGQLVRVAGPIITDSDPSSGTYNNTIRTVTLYSYDNLGQLLNIQAGKTASDGGVAAGINPDTGVSGGDTVATQAGYVHDDFGRKLTETDANGNSANYTYDLNNNVLTANTANGHTLNYTWGYGHQMQSMSAEDGRNVQYTRNPLGQIANVETWSANPNSQLDVAYYYSYDASHRLANVTDSRADKTLSYSWSPGGLLNSMTDSDSNGTNYLYDPVGRLTSLWATNYDGYSFAYDSGGRLTQVVYPNGVSQTQSWNADNTLAQISHQGAGAIIEQSVYGYDGLGRRQSNQETLSPQALPANTEGPVQWIVQATLSYSYSYDALDRLTGVSNGTATLNETYGYDRFGNRVLKQIGSPVTGTYAYLYDAANQLTETHQTNTTGTLLEAYLYDNSGNEIKKCSGGAVTHASATACTGSSVSVYIYNSFNRFSQFNFDGAVFSSYLYDHQGRRIQKIDNLFGINVSNYLYDGDNVYETFMAGSWSLPSALYVQAGTDHPLAVLTGNVGDPGATANYYHQDGLGSVMAATGANKSVTALQRFDAFGNMLASINGFQYGYTGREPDASGLIYYRARYYDPNQIRFTQRDPAGFRDGVNPYLYVHNNPVNFTDPDGLLAQQINNAVTPSTSYYSSYTGGIGYGGTAWSSGLLGSLSLGSGQSANPFSSSIFTGQSYQVADASSVLGVIWNSPNTVLGLALGAAGLPFGGQVSCCANNAIQFTNNPLMSSSGAITLGNVINYGANNGPQTILSNGYSTGDHEDQHTLQGQQLGPLYLPSNLLGGISGLILNDSWHGSANWNETGPQSAPPSPW